MVSEGKIAKQTGRKGLTGLFRVWVWLAGMFMLTGSVHARYGILSDSATMVAMEQCLDDIYSFRFDRAAEYAVSFRKEHPQHPAGPFLEALIIYWKNLPLTPDHPESENYQVKLEEAIDLARERMADDPMEVEGVFFDLVGQGMLMMYYADNGLTGKVIPYLSPSYRSLKKGFELQEQFGEFMFTTGLYNYYIEAYPRMYPGYRPLALLFPRGDMQQGLVMLETVAGQGIYLKNEALLFLNHLYLSYEDDPFRSLEYIRKLVDDYPDNFFYRSRLLLNLIAIGQTRECAEEMNILRRQYPRHPFVTMVLNIFDGYIYEKVFNDPDMSRGKYLTGIESGKVFGVWVNTYLAVAYAGLARISHREGERSLAREYERLAESTTQYRFILDME